MIMHLRASVRSFHTILAGNCKVPETPYLGSYFTAGDRRRYVSAKTKPACREILRRAMSDANQRPLGE